MPLAVQDQAPFVHLPIQVDGQGGHDGTQAIHLNQKFADPLRTFHAHAPRHQKLAIQPGVVQKPAIGLHRQPTASAGDQLRMGADAKTRTVGVRKPQGHPLGALVGSDPGDQGSPVHQKPLGAAGGKPLGAGNLAKPAPLQATGDLVGGVPGRGSRVQEAEEVVGQRVKHRRSRGRNRRASRIRGPRFAVSRAIAPALARNCHP